MKIKIVITTVGTSIFENYQNEYSDLKDKIEDLKLKLYDDWNEREEDIKNIRRTISEWMSENSSAEIKSLIKIQKKMKSKINAILLTTDTILSNLAAKMVEEYFKKNNYEISVKNIIMVRDLQVEDYHKFIKGRDNLVREIREIIKKEFEEIKDAKKAFKAVEENYIFNISGGYKIIIPIITVISQIYRIKSFILLP